MIYDVNDVYDGFEVSVVDVGESHGIALFKTALVAKLFKTALMAKVV